MISYRFRRRAFLTALSGGIGLKIMLRNLEGSAQGMRSPARLLVTHWPIGIVAGSGDALWKPTSGSVGGSPALKPFADMGLGPDMTVIRGLSTQNLPLAGGGGHQGGTVLLMTGRGAGGTRANRALGDDAFAAPGGSVDQVLLENVPALQRPGQGYANSIADSRTDSGEISTKCLSYSTATQSVPLYSGAGYGTESIPRMPVLSPLSQYANLFQTFVPGTAGTFGSGGAGGGPAPRVADATLKALVGRQSVLDFSIAELNQLKRMVPSEARNKLSIHTDAVLAAETSVVNAINRGYPSSGAGGASGTGGNGDPTCNGGCKIKPPAPPNMMGMPDYTTGFHGNYDNPGREATDDAAVHAQVGRAHLDVLKAAFICDLIRVGTFQWAPGDNHVGFAGLYPNDTKPYQHHAMSHRIGAADETAATTLAGLKPEAVFLYNVQVWYFLRYAEALASWKNSVDGCGNSLLDSTCVPLLTEVGTCDHQRSNMPAMIIGGKQLGFIHDRYVAQSITINQFWGTIAQAFGYTSTDPAFGAPVDGFWAKP